MLLRLPHSYFAQNVLIFPLHSHHFCLHSCQSSYSSSFWPAYHQILISFRTALQSEVFLSFLGCYRLLILHLSFGANWWHLPSLAFKFRILKPNSLDSCHLMAIPNSPLSISYLKTLLNSSLHRPNQYHSLLSVYCSLPYSLLQWSFPYLYCFQTLSYQSYQYFNSQYAMLQLLVSITTSIFQHFTLDSCYSVEFIYHLHPGFTFFS
jgi:hypothetical protein